jgi:hypothetical protein
VACTQQELIRCVVVLHISGAKTECLSSNLDYGNIVHLSLGGNVVSFVL